MSEKIVLIDGHSIINRAFYGIKLLTTKDGRYTNDIYGFMNIFSNAILLKTALPDTEIIVDASCCAGVTPQSHQNALEAMKMCQINVIGE